MCLKLSLYPQATRQITKLKGNNEYTHSRAKIHCFAKIFFHTFENNCLVHLQEYT